ncbi:hypothetical protein IGI04_035194 [Brassica rapa subsp. trilocularis]|uniref:Uncharacterized protein n=1 Tax=Brassica rapa subsp. trilocularis TaxID=1813537 RepID=A0ABQ7LAY3_BRACM|nr:hypothetical protein IGI04_035194 [Brassica rapa subsp. trilocularis]
MPLSPFMDLLQLAGWFFLNATFAAFCSFGNGELASSTSSIKYGGVNKIETVTVSELNTYVVNSKPQEAGELMNYAADGNISLFPGVDLKLRFNSYRVFLWVKSMLFIMRFEAFDDVCDILCLNIDGVKEDTEWMSKYQNIKGCWCQSVFIHFIVMLCYCFAQVSLKRGRDMAELVPKYGLPSLAQRHG